MTICHRMLVSLQNTEKMSGDNDTFSLLKTVTG